MQGFYDVASSDVLGYDMIWYDMIWYDMIWYDMIWYNNAEEPEEISKETREVGSFLGKAVLQRII